MIFKLCSYIFLIQYFVRRNTNNLYLYFTFLVLKQSHI